MVAFKSVGLEKRIVLRVLDPNAVRSAGGRLKLVAVAKRNDAEENIWSNRERSEWRDSSASERTPLLSDKVSIRYWRGSKRVLDII